MLVAIDNSNGQILLEKRPQTGVWGGLWSLPQFDSIDELKLAADRLSAANTPLDPPLEKLGPIEHTFTHFHLTIHPLIAHIDKQDDDTIMDTEQRVWYKHGDTPGGFAAPVAKLLEQLSVSLV